MKHANRQYVWRRLAETAPVLSLAAVLVLPMLLWQRTSESADASRTSERIAAAIDRVPYRIGAWAGQDQPVPDSAIKLLRPNAILSRRFVNLDTQHTLDLILVHCTDTRDMLGHYPPVCYPAHGWVFSGPAPKRRDGREYTLDALGRTWPIRVYEFARIRDWSSEVRIRVISFFVLPDGSITNTIDDVHSRTSYLDSTIEGVAQVQLVTSDDRPVEGMIADAARLLEGASDLFSALGISDDR